MKRTALFILLAALALAAQEPARVREAPLTIPTYLLDAPDPNPAFLLGERRSARPVYPYALLDSLTRQRADKDYKAVYLENEYLRVTVLPEMGGKLYSIFDKTANREVLYTNHVVKYGIVGIRGAWISGGIEWNFPDGHTVTTVSPIDYLTGTGPDGSAWVTVGDTERIQRMQWAVTIRLRPGWKVVETEVRLNNRREVPGRYWFWATAAAPARDDLRFVYPMREAYPHVFWPVYSFPIENGRDVGTYRDVPHALSLFARNSKRDFMGVYYEKSDYGVIHVADHHEVPGKKTWTWGTEDAGKIWIEKLTDNDGQYVEFQAGRYETQMEHEFLAPHRVEHFTEYWYPVERLGGGFDEANRNAALHISVKGSEAEVSVNANTRFDAMLSVGSASVAAPLDPKTPFRTVIKLAPEDAGKPLTVRLVDRGGTELLRYRTDTPIDGNPDFRPATKPVPDPAAPSSAEQAYVEGLAEAKKSHELLARVAYEKALERDPNFAPAHVALGLSLYRSGEYDQAASHLEAALRRNPDNGDAHYYFGLVRHAQGRDVEAQDHLWLCVRSGWREPVARFLLGEIALARGGDAVTHLKEAVRLDPRDLKSRTVLALALRAANRLEEAFAAADVAVRQMPIDYFAISERQQALQALGKSDEAARASEVLWRLLAREPDSALELAFDYSAAGRSADSIQVLEEAARRLKPWPLIPYTLGYFYTRAGQEDRAAEQFAAGAKGDPAYVFPHRVEAVGVLRAAIQANPKDGRAYYYLGNVLANLVRPEEAQAAWREATRLDPANAVAHRNLAQLLEGKEAVAEYERAIQAAPEEFHLYLELDRVLAAQKDTAARLKLLEGAPKPVRARPAVMQALAAASTDAGRFEDAIRLLSGAEFTSGEGQNSALAIYRAAHVGLARKYQDSGDHAKAAAEFQKAAEFPRNLGVGASSEDREAKEYAAAAAEELRKAGRK